MLLISRLNMEKAEKLTHARVYEIYLEWCGVYEKQVDQSRFNLFKSNFLSMEALADERGTSMQLSKWYDCTEEEYLVQSGKETATEVLVDDDEFEDEVYADVIDADVTQAEHGIIEETVEDVNLSHETELRRSHETELRRKQMAGKIWEHIIILSCLFLYSCNMLPHFQYSSYRIKSEIHPYCKIRNGKYGQGKTPGSQRKRCCICKFISIRKSETKRISR